MVGLATLSDMVPLLGENRTLAFYGLKVLQKSPRVGLRKLFGNLRIDQRNVTEDDIVFMITPRLNAASRMGVPMDAFKLFSTTDEAEAGALAIHLNKKNDERKGLVASMVKEIKKKIREVRERPRRRRNEKCFGARQSGMEAVASRTRGQQFFGRTLATGFFVGS